MSKSESIKEITIALAKAQIAFKPIKRTEKVGYDTQKGRKQYNYAPLNEVIEATKQALSDNGLAITQATKIVEENTILETLLSHSSGEWLSGELYVGKQDQSPQSEGSALTYKRRYGMSAILNVASEEDDDGESATEKEPTPKAIIPTPAEVPVSEIKKETEVPIELPDCNSVGEALNYATKHGWTLAKIKTATGINNPTDIKDISAFMAVLFPNSKPKSKTLIQEAKQLGAVEIKEGE